MGNYYIIHLEYDSDHDIYSEKMECFTENQKDQAEKFLELQPEAIIVFGQLCKVQTRCEIVKQ